jgi:hypothetical protein
MNGKMALALVGSLAFTVPAMAYIYENIPVYTRILG